MTSTSTANPTSIRPARADALLSIVLPVYNEQGVLETLYEAVTTAATRCGLPHEIVFVNDGSRDRSPEILDRLAACDPRVRVLHFSRNFGHQAAVHAGLLHASGDAVVLMDSDLQDDPAAIERFVEKWREGYQVVYAIRTDRKENRCKRFLFASFHRILSRIASPPIPADAGNFGLVDRRVLEAIVALPDRDRYLPGLRSWVGFKQTGVPVERLARYDKRPRVSLWGLWRLAKTAIFSFSSFPLAVFYLIAWSALAVFVVLGGLSLGCKLFTDLAVPGWASQVLIACFFGAINALGIGILGEYVVRTYDQVRGRPLFLVARQVNFSRKSQSGRSAEIGRSEAAGEAASLAAATTRPSPGPAPDDQRLADPYLELLEQVTTLLDTASPAAQLPAAELQPQPVAPRF